MNYKIGILGATGRMGLEVAALTGAGFWVGNDCLELTLAVAHSGRIKSVEGVPVSTMDDFPNDLAHCWIDFSRPAATLSVLPKLNCPVVIGTTGFSNEEMKTIENYANRHAVVLAANTSPGMNQMAAMLRTYQLPSELKFDAVLWEEHHVHKKDAPSGTAKELLAILAEKNLAVQVLVSRAGGTKGVHSVRFVSEDEEIEITHRVNDRRIFAKGALLAARFLCSEKRSPGIYTMAEVFSRSGEIK